MASRSRPAASIDTASRLRPTDSSQVARQVLYTINHYKTGEPGDTETTLTSDPTLPEPDIMALLVTGRTLQVTLLDVTADKRFHVGAAIDIGPGSQVYGNFSRGLFDEKFRKRAADWKRSSSTWPRRTRGLRTSPACASSMRWAMA